MRHAVRGVVANACSAVAGRGLTMVLCSNCMGSLPESAELSHAVRAIAGEQEGIVTRSQLLSAGIGNSVVARAVGSGRLHRIHAGVYAAVAPELLTEDGQLLAALLGAGEGALLSHGTAAWRWRIIPAPPSVMQLAVPQPRTPPAGVALHQCGRLRADDVTLNGRFPPPPSLAPSWTSRLATPAARCCAPWPRPSSSTTYARRTSSARCGAAIRAARTCAPRWPNTRPATAT